MKSMQNLKQCGLDSLELKALSVPSSLRFLLGIEYDVVLCVNEVGTRRPFRLHFPVFAPTFRKLLTLCATRFGLDCEHGDAESVLSGTAVMPLLRYADYLPGALHVKEILECLQVEPATKAKRWQPHHTSGGVTTSASAAAACAPSDSTSSATSTSATNANEFEASFIDYAEFASDSSLDDVHGLGFYLLLDYGLSLATHSHLVGIRFHKDWDATEALREFQEFSGWSAFDLRFLDEQRKQEGGVIVMPSSQDACDLLEKYEDEDSDDEGDLLPFILRPVSPLVSVPSLEDSALRKLRDQHWVEVEKHWSHLPRTLNTVVVYNLYEGATLAEILAFFEPLPVVASEFVEDDAPTHRRRAFLTFANLEATRKALDVDGKNTRGCTLRVQVSPPYISESRRGHEVKPERPPVAVASTTAAGSSPKLAANGNGVKTAAAAVPAGSPSSSPSTRAADHTAAHAKPAEKAPAEASRTQPQTRSAATAPPTTATSLLPAAATHVNVPSSAAVPRPASAANAAAALSPSTRPVNASAAIAGAIAARAHAASATTTAAGLAEAPKAAGASLSSAPIALPHVTAAGSADPDAASPSVGSAASSHGGTHMNASAKEFVPHFQLSATSPEYHPAPPPTADVLYGFNGQPVAASEGPAGAAGSRHVPSSVPPPPPAYGNMLSPAVDYRPTPRSAQLLHAGAVPNLPTYALPPPYIPGEEEMEDAMPPPSLPPPY